jgi:hypothetical protein
MHRPIALTPPESAGDLRLWYAHLHGSVNGRLLTFVAGPDAPVCTTNRPSHAQLEREASPLSLNGSAQWARHPV